MGEAAVGERATPAQLEAMTTLLGESLRAGGLGLSSGRTTAHQDWEGEYVPSYHASDEELLALCRIARDHPGTTLEFAPSLADFEATGELMIRMSLEAGRPINWNVLIVNAARPEEYQGQLALSDRAAARGARVVPLSVPHPMDFYVDPDAVGTPGCSWNELYKWAIPICNSVDGVQPMSDNLVESSILRGMPSGLLVSNLKLP